MRIGIITDIHENVEMLQQSLRQAAAYKCDDLVCLGDIVGFDRRYYRYNTKRSAKKCLEIIMSSFRWVVAGNHDLFAANRFPFYSNGFDYPENWFQMDPDERKMNSTGKVWCYEGDEPHDLEEAEIIYLRTLPEYIITAEPGIPCLFSHYIYPDVTGSTTRYVERNHQMKGHWDFMDSNNIKYSFSGHSHELFAGFAYRNKRSFFKAVHNLPSDSFKLGDEMVMTVLPPLTGEKGRTGFAILDTSTLKLNIIPTGTG
jgi:predicted phosphodiesterase